MRTLIVKNFGAQFDYYVFVCGNATFLDGMYLLVLLVQIHKDPSNMVKLLLQMSMLFSIDLQSL